MGRAILIQKYRPVVLLVALLASLAVGHAVLASGEVFTSPSNKTMYEGQNITITDLQVNGTGDENLQIVLNVDNGSLQFNNSDGLTFTGPTYGTKLQISGTRSHINAALATLQYQAGDVGEHTIEVTLGDGNYFADNGHVYSVVSDSGITWQGAKDAAEAMQYGGVSGYLATITSQGEHDFIRARINNSGWIGANDIASEGVWRWVTGPEAGDQFFSGDFEGGTAFNGAFTNWNDGEPNNSGNNEDCGQIYFTESSDGQWNDLTCTSDENEYYVVEFGAPGALPNVVSTDFTVTVNPAPAIAFTHLTPADNSEVNSVSSVSITFNQPMTLGEGSLNVYDSFNNELVAELWNADTEDNLTFNFTLPDSLQVGKNYYVTISDSFMEGLVDYYSGFDDKTTWNFKVIDAVTPNGGDANGDGIIDNQQPNVDGAMNAQTGKYVAIDVGSDCSLDRNEIKRESNFVIQDAAYEYDNGLWAFEAACGTPGFTTTIKLYYYDISAENMVVRKHNPVTGAYFSLPDATIVPTIINGQSVIVVTYQVKDGGDRDTDGLENGTIVDPVGLARNIVGVPNTGLGKR